MEAASHNPKQPFSRQNYVGTLGGPIAENKVWFFSSFENVHENASIAYSPASMEQFEALSQIASQGLIPGVPSIAVPATVPIPFRDYLGSVRFDWAQSDKSQWFLRTSEDSYLTRNALVAARHAALHRTADAQQLLERGPQQSYIFSPTWLGNLVLAASLLHLTQTRNSDLGFALAFPFSSTALTISGFETFGDNQFATPITLFPDVRNQDKYQARYDLSHVAGNHALRFGVDFIHEPVLGGAFASTAEQFIQYPSNPDCYIKPAGRGLRGYHHRRCRSTTWRRRRSATPRPIRLPASPARYTPASDGSFSQNVQRLAFYGEDSWRVSHRFTLNYGLRYQSTFGLFEGSGRTQLQNSAYITLQALQIPIVPGCAARLPQADRAAPWRRLVAAAAAKTPFFAPASVSTTTTSRRTGGPPRFRESTTPTR